MKRRVLKKASCLAIPLLLLAVFSFMAFRGEKIRVNDGLGWDGVGYAKVTKDFQSLIYAREITVYQLVRCLPPAVVHYSLRILKLPLENSFIIKGFVAYNLILLAVCVALWGGIAQLAGLDEKKMRFGYPLLFVSFAVIKMSFYYPVLIDLSAFTLGLGLLYFYLSGNTFGHLIILLLSAFTWPTAFYNAAILYLFPKDLPAVKPGGSRLHVTVPLLACGVFIVLFIYFYYVERNTWLDISKRLLPISVLSVLLYLFFYLRYLFKDVKIDLSLFLKDRSILKRAFALILFIAAFGAISSFFKPSGSAFIGVIRNVILTSCGRPFIFLIAHAVYFGPIVIIALLFYKELAKTIQKWGPGAIILFSLNLGLAIFSESRCLINMIPFVVFFVLISTDSAKWPAKVYAFFLIVAVIFSKFWLNLNTDIEFYLMNIGPWMSKRWYIIQGGAVLAVLLITGIIKYRFSSIYRSRRA